MPPEVGDEVAIDWEAVVHCPQRETFHAAHPECYTPTETGKPAKGEVYAATPANGGPEGGHGLLVALDCPHRCAMAMTFGELSRG